MGIFASFPFLTGLAGNLLGGALTERLIVRHGRKRVYRLVTGICLLLTACLLLAMSLVRGKILLVVLATLGLGVMDLMLPAAWAMCMSIGGRYGGTATAVMNTAGNLGGWISAIVFGYIVAATNDYNPPLRLIAGMVLVAAAIFSRIDCDAGMRGMEIDRLASSDA